MHHLNAPSRSPQDEMLTEIGELLARGLIRLLARKSSPLSADCRDSSLDLPANQSGHATPKAERKT